MNKTELINAMAEKAGLSKVDAKKALDAFVEAVSESLVKGDKVALIGFGTFGVTEKAVRTVSTLQPNRKSLSLLRKWLNLKPVQNWQTK